MIAVGPLVVSAKCKVRIESKVFPYQHLAAYLHTLGGSHNHVYQHREPA